MLNMFVPYFRLRTNSLAAEELNNLKILEISVFHGGQYDNDVSIHRLDDRDNTNLWNKTAWSCFPERCQLQNTCSQSENECNWFIVWGLCCYVCSRISFAKQLNRFCWNLMRGNGSLHWRLSGELYWTNDDFCGTLLGVVSLKYDNISQVPLSTFETLVNFYETTRLNYPKDKLSSAV
jgi:hypothetical protein